MNEHVDVAAYVLGLLESTDASRFEQHLVQCADCAAELESMLHLTDLLADVDPGDLVGIEGADSTGAASADAAAIDAALIAGAATIEAALAKDARRRPELHDPPRQGRRRTERRQPEHRHPGFHPPESPVGARPRRSVVPIAVAAAIIGVLAGGGAVAAGPWHGTPTATRPALRLVADQRLSATDSRTGVHADVALASKSWGTQVSFTISDLNGPRTCRLVAVRADGTNEVLSSWTVPPRGSDAQATPARLDLEASTALGRRNITALKVQQVASSGNATTLVTLRT
jgi:hypothetical protein